MWPFQVSLFLIAGRGLGWDMFGGRSGFAGLTVLAVVSLGAGWALERVRQLAQENIEKDRLVASVSHEVRNPLTGIVGLSTLLVQEWDTLKPDEAREMVTVIAAEAQSLAMIVNDLLDASRLRSGTVQLEARPVELAGLATALPVVETVVGEGEGVTVTADPTRVRQIIRNLVINAERHGVPPVEVFVGRRGPVGWLEVVDRGPGVTDSVAERLFLPFASGGGPDSVGLGLWVSRQLALAMKGDLHYERRNDQTVFRLELPIHDGELEPTPPSELVEA
jgi:signal transduction histidine kinase